MIIAETITWHAVADELPDSDITVIVHAPGADEPIWFGFYDGVYWFATTGEEYSNEEEIAAPVTHWAEFPVGPHAVGLKPYAQMTETQCLFLEVGLTPDECQVIVNHPALIPDERGGHIVFSPAHAIALGNLLIKKALECRQ